MSDVFTLDSKSCLKNSQFKTRVRDKSLQPVSLVLLVPVLAIKSVVFLKIKITRNRTSQDSGTVQSYTK